MLTKLCTIQYIMLSLARSLTLLKDVPVKVCYLFFDTAFSVVVICNKSGCSSLDHLNLMVDGAKVVAAYSTLGQTNIL